MSKQRRSAAIVLIIGLVGLTQLMRGPRFEAMHTVDVLQLLASGACFGVAASLLIHPRRRFNNAD